MVIRTSPLTVQHAVRVDMPNQSMPPGYVKIDGKRYPTKELQQFAYSDVIVIGTPGKPGAFLAGKPIQWPLVPQLVWPLDKVFITQGFGQNPQIYAQFGLKGHDGIDLRTRFFDSPLGHMYVKAAHAGTVEIRFDGKKGYGTHIRLKDSETGAITIYGHLSQVYLKQGQTVAQGQRIGLTGATGFIRPNNILGSHLHFELRPGNANPSNGYAGAIDPIPYLPKLK